MKHCFLVAMILCGLAFQARDLAAAGASRVAVRSTAELREALAAVDQGEAVVILLEHGGRYSVTPVPETRNLCLDYFYPVSSDLPLIKGHVTIIGRGATLRGINGAVLPFCVTESGSLTLKNLTLTAFGLVVPPVDYVRPTVAYIRGEARILSSQIIGNGAPASAPYTIRNQGNLRVEGSLIANNVASKTGAGIFSEGDLALLNSSIVNNRLVASTKRIDVLGAGLATDGGEALLRNVTISGNELRLADYVPARGNVRYSVAPAISATETDILLEHVTVVNNTSAFDVRTNAAVFSESMLIRNSIIANNEGDNCLSTVEPGFTLQGANLIDDDSCAAKSDQHLLITDPDLAALEAVGGLPVHVPLASSEALNRADPAFCPPRDEVGRPRSVSAGRACEIGAVERIPEPFEINRLLTATWYDPQHDGHYLSVEVLPDNRLFALWSTYTPDGEQLWLFGSGEIDGGRAEFIVYESRGMALPDLNAADREIDPWGTLILEFPSCQSLHLRWNPQEPGYSMGRATLRRLTHRHPELSCEST